MHWRTAAIIWISFYALISIYYLFSGADKYHALIVGVLVLAFFVLSRSALHIPAHASWLVGASLLFNAVGSFPLPGEGFTLYMIPQYDLFAHAVGFFLFTLGFASVIYANEHRIRFQHILLISLALMGIGAMIELCEYAGFRLLGYGAGWLQFGAGDQGQMYGPWQDAMSDMLANLAGIGLAMLLLHVRRRWGRSIRTVIRH